MELEFGQLRLGDRIVPDEASSEKHSQRLETQVAQGRRASPVPGDMIVVCRKSDGRTCRLAIRKAA